MKSVIDLIKKPEIDLEDGQNSAIIITQTWNSTHNFPKIKSKCSFKIKNKKQNSGIYIVITKLKFRKDPSTNNCIDYIEFSHSSNFNDRTCDTFDETRGLFLYLNISEKEVRITVSVNKNIEITEPLELNITAISHYECSGKNSDYQCDPNDRYSCVSKDVINKGIINCIPFSCRDKTSCTLKPINVKNIDVSNVAISAITSFIFTIVAVGTCLWICWKYRNCVNLNQEDNQNNEQQQTEVIVNKKKLDN